MQPTLTSDSLRIVHVAPASARVADGPYWKAPYWTSDKDLVIGAIRGALANTLEPNIFTIPLRLGSDLGHGFVETYMEEKYDAYLKIKGSMDTALAALEAPPCAAAVVYVIQTTAQEITNEGVRLFTPVEATGSSTSTFIKDCGSVNGCIPDNSTIATDIKTFEEVAVFIGPDEPSNDKLYNPLVCRLPDRWIPVHYQWNASSSISAGSPCTGSPLDQTWSGSFDLDRGGNLRATFQHNILTDTHCPLGTYTSDQTQTSVTNKSYETNLDSGSGSYSGTYSMQGTNLQTYLNYGVVSDQQTRLWSDSASWPAETTVPPTLPGVGLKTFRMYLPGEPLPPECTDSS